MAERRRSIEVAPQELAADCEHSVPILSRDALGWQVRLIALLKLTPPQQLQPQENLTSETTASD